MIDVFDLYYTSTYLGVLENDVIKVASNLRRELSDQALMEGISLSQLIHG